MDNFELNGFEWIKRTHPDRLDGRGTFYFNFYSQEYSRDLYYFNHFAIKGKSLDEDLFVNIFENFEVEIPEDYKCLSVSGVYDDEEDLTYFEGDVLKLNMVIYPKHRAVIYLARNIQVYQAIYNDQEDRGQIDVLSGSSRIDDFPFPVAEN